MKVRGESSKKGRDYSIKRRKKPQEFGDTHGVQKNLVEDCRDDVT